MFILDRESDEKYIQLACWSAPEQDRPTFKHAVKQEYKKIKKGHRFGPSWTTHWVRVTMTVPERFSDYEHVEFRWDSHNEGLIWSEDGEPLQGLTGGGERTEYFFPRDWLDGKEHVFYVEVACNGMFGNAASDIIQPPDPNR